MVIVKGAATYVNLSYICISTLHDRFAPIWKDLASDVKDWAPTVKIGAINCADQACDRYQVRQTGSLQFIIQTEYAD